MKRPSTHVEQSERREDDSEDDNIEPERGSHVEQLERREDDNEEDKIEPERGEDDSEEEDIDIDCAFAQTRFMVCSVCSLPIVERQYL